MQSKPPTTKTEVTHLATCASEIGGGFCENCLRPVTTVDGRYTCTNCGANGGG